VSALVLDFEAVYEIDIEGADMAAQLASELSGQPPRVIIARAHTGAVGDARDAAR
jgi:hypothetical protein